MRTQHAINCLTICALLASAAAAHGPQIQLTIDNNKLVNRQLLIDSPYSTTLTPPTSAYVFPAKEFNNIWYTRPNGELNGLGQPVYYSGPGIAFGYDQVDGGPEAFTVGSLVSVGFTTGLKKWDGSTLADAGAMELEIFRGSGASLQTARTLDAGPSGVVNYAAIPAPLNGVAYNGEGIDAHNTTRFRFLGDGLSTSVAPADGVYVVGLQYRTTQAGISPSDPFYFVISKNGSAAAVAGAVGVLGLSAAQVQFVPEPNGMAAALGLIACGLGFVRRRGQS
jgi:hypothetical protein